MPRPRSNQLTIRIAKTVRIWDPKTGEQKMEMRGHDNDVEVVVFAPLAAYTAIRELAGIPVCLSPASFSRGAQRHLFF